MSKTEELHKIRDRLDAKEAEYLAPGASLSRNALRRRPEDRQGHRQNFALDADRILHTRAYTRYIDKTQVFYMVRNDHITHRVLHVQLVSKIGRTIGRFLGLNEDLIEAIALAHDIGHPPFGHDGEKVLSELCREHGLPGFQHNIESVVFLDRIEKHGRGCNLTLQTLDGILCHDGEIHNRSLVPQPGKTFAHFDREMAAKGDDPKIELAPMTLEGCVARFADTIAYIGRDIEDAILLKLIERDDIPAECQTVLGRSNGTIVYNLVTDLVASSSITAGLCFSPEVADRLLQLKHFNYERIYLNPAIKQRLPLVRQAYRVLFTAYFEQIRQGRHDAVVFHDFLNGLDDEYHANTAPAAKVRDFLAGMTDDYFLTQAAHYGCKVPVQA
ncbi:MAG: phosphohydrolase [Deltaproteobacteria bacterium CG_4_10_14_3_um_filter_60_8]|nr:MAG: phosphohydrolase [Deltaproteobacteria bacterium CG_4_10_14_3_um_filter_60_8]